MKEQLKKLIGPIIGVVLFALALSVLQRQLAEYTYDQIGDEFLSIPREKVCYSILFTVISYLLLTLYDLFAIKYVGGNLPYWKVAMASYVGYTLSHNLGFSLVTGGAARFRLFSLWGLSTTQIAQAIAFSGLMFWFGWALLSGIVLCLEPPPAIGFLSDFPIGFQLLGAILLLATLWILTWWCGRHHPLKLKDFEFHSPPVKLVVSCLMAAATDWFFACGVMFVLLPKSSLNLLQFLGVFQLSQIIGLVSNVPGGLGVFEAIVMLFIPPEIPRAQVIGVLIAYRIIYYIVPLALSTTLLLTHEIVHQREFVVKVARKAQEHISVIMPTILTILTFASGAVLLFSGATPALHDRMNFLAQIVPLPLIELSHFVGSLAGVGLILLARGLQRKLDAAYVLTIVLLFVGITASILKGFDYEEAVILSIIFLLLLPCHDNFRRKAKLFSQPFTPGWVTAIALVILATFWLVFFAHKNVDYSNDLWWRFSLYSDAPRSLRALVGIITLGIVWGGAKLLSPLPAEPQRPLLAELELAEEIVRTAENTYAGLALVGDKAFFFNDEKSAFVMFDVEGRSWISLGDPVGPEDALPDLAWSFREMCDRHDGYCVFYQVRPQHLPMYIDIGLSLVKLGEEALVELPGFSLDGKARSGMRYIRNKFEKDGYRVRIAPTEEVERVLPTLKGISDAWLKEKNTREKGFSLGFFEPNYLRRFPAAIVERHGEIAAFSNVMIGANKNELSVDLMRYMPGTMPSVMEYLFIELMLWGKAEGFQYFNLGMAPLSGLENHELAPFWNKMGAMVFKHGEHFYNFKGIRAYKEKYGPIWEPRYLACPGGIRLPMVLTNIASLISGGLKGLIAK